MAAIGAMFGPYQIVERIGSGGMGDVYRALDTRLERIVALKILRDELSSNPDLAVRFEQEARLAATLNDSHVCAVYDVGSQDGIEYLVMEYLEGETLAERLKRKRVSRDDAILWGIQLAGALDQAHRNRLIHRDIKPGNIILTKAGVKLVDFGLAKRVGLPGSADITVSGALIGTVAYMCPEQVEGRPVDCRADIFGLGVVLYEMLTGTHPFTGSSSAAILSAILTVEPPPVGSAHLDHIVQRCLAKDPAERWQTARDLMLELEWLGGAGETVTRRGYGFIASVEAVERRGYRSLRGSPSLSSDAGPSRWRLPRRLILVPGAITLVLLIALTSLWSYRRGATARWAKGVALPEATRLVSAGSYAAAFPYIYQALQILPRELAFGALRRNISYPIPIRTVPSGADVYLKPYGNPNSAWVFIGQSPLENFLLPGGLFRWKIAKQGFRSVECAAGLQAPTLEFVLDPEGSIPPEMIHVPRGNSRLFSLGPVSLDDYWMDKYEVTNKQFKAFVDQGGYRSRQYWREEFAKDGRVLSWEQAMMQFRDATGRPGPATWDVGDYAAGHDDFPVNGVSWYEAAAYAEFAKKRLPTIYHWYRAASQGIYSDILQFSNFDGSGPVQVGSRTGLGAFGTYDMAGNVKEWCWNGTASRRYILGGGWNEGTSYYVAADALSPFDRSSGNGFRCVKYPGGALPDALTRPVESRARDHRTEKPVSDKVFRILQSSYTYDRTELKAVKESVDETSPLWRVEKITFDAAYDHQRVVARLYLPRHARPPYQTIIYFPAGVARMMATVDEVEIKRFDFLIRSGRAVLFPVYQGTYERRPKSTLGRSGERDEVIQQCKDLQRSLDYLETRTDVARDRVGYFGISAGARLGTIILAQEPRIRAATLAEGGFSAERRPPEIDEINFAPRVRIPVLMFNGRYDFLHPVETDQMPMFRLLGTPQKAKRLVLLERGHNGPVQQYVKETLAWFDRYLGPTGT